MRWLNRSLRYTVLSSVLPMLWACGNQASEPRGICQIDLTAPPFVETGQSGRYRDITMLSERLQASRSTGQPSNVVTLLALDQLTTVTIFVDGPCDDLEPVFQHPEQIATEPGEEFGFRFLDYAIRLTPQIGLAAQSEVEERIYTQWNHGAQEDCVVRMTAETDAESTLTSQATRDAAHAVLSRMAESNALYGVPFAEHLVYDNVLVAALQAHCDRRDEAVLMMAHAWATNHATELAEFGLTGLQFDVTHEGVTLDDLHFVPSPQDRN